MCGCVWDEHTHIRSAVLCNDLLCDTRCICLLYTHCRFYCCKWICFQFCFSVLAQTIQAPVFSHVPADPRPVKDAYQTQVLFLPQFFSSSVVAEVLDSLTETNTFHFKSSFLLWDILVLNESEQGDKVIHPSLTFNWKCKPKDPHIEL